MLRLPLTFCVFVLLAAPCAGQESPKRKKTTGDEETARMQKLIEKVYRKPATERDRVVRELARLDPRIKIGTDHRDWFDLLAQNRPYWARSDIGRMDLAEVFDRVAERLGIRDGKISRSDFLSYARLYWGDNSPPWKPPEEVEPAVEADKLFRRFDRNSDLSLQAGEMPEPLLADVRRWDRSGDGMIDAVEYRLYFNTRLDRIDREYKKVAPMPEAVEDDRPLAPRAGKLPPGLPTWFLVLDQDRDGQVGLFEWRRAGWPLEEFDAVDPNGDGLLTPTELLRQLARVDASGARPFGYLQSRQPPGAAPTARNKKGR